MKNKPVYLYLSGIVLLIPALLINLGHLNIFMAVDEATRALVALEMMITDNFITPTINGEYYYNKPPLYNWILVGLFSLFGFDEFVMRLPTAVSLLGFGFTVFYFVKQELGIRAAAITAFAFVTSGRILFWESLLGYIDTTFSWVVYSGLMFIHHFFKQKKFLHLFVVSYFFMAIGFMMKGLPAIVFQGITLLVVFLSEREFRKLFSWQHVAGAMAFIIPVGIYYLIYNQYNSLENVYTTLWNESTNRTVVNQGWVLTFQHLYLFPVQMLYHFLPWTLLIAFTFRKGFWQKVWQNKFIKFNLLVVLFNIIPYWTSPDVYPKYIMMLMPMVFTVFVYFFLKNKAQRGKASHILEMILLGAAAVLTVAYLALPFVPDFQDVPGRIIISILLFLLSGFFTFLYFKIKSSRLVIFAILLIIGRLAFDWYVWPQRAAQYTEFEQSARKVAEITGQEPVSYYDAPMLQYGASYYMSLEKWQVIRQETGRPQPGRFYIVDDASLKKLQRQSGEVKVFYSYRNVEDGRRLSLVKVNPHADE
ncbi:MAG: ArnT family glycosyltransferase [Bacteroidales bacterium]